MSMEKLFQKKNVTYGYEGKVTGANMLFSSFIQQFYKVNCGDFESALGHSF